MVTEIIKAKLHRGIKSFGIIKLLNYTFCMFCSSYMNHQVLKFTGELLRILLWANAYLKSIFSVASVIPHFLSFLQPL